MPSSAQALFSSSAAFFALAFGSGEPPPFPLSSPASGAGASVPVLAVRKIHRPKAKRDRRRIP
jgi:hypothetical protein